MKIKLFWMTVAVMFTSLFAASRNCSITCNDIKHCKEKNAAAVATKNHEKDALGQSPMAHFFLMEI
jgi:hypothetical protein